MDSLDGPGSKPPVQDIASRPVTEEPEAPVTGTHKFRKVKKIAGKATRGLSRRIRRKKPESRAFEQLRAKVKPATAATQLKASQLNARAVSESRVFTSKELFAAAGAEHGQGKKLKALGAMLDKYNTEVQSPQSRLSPAEKVIRTLQLREAAQSFLEKKEHELTRVLKFHAQSKQRIMATHQLLGQLQLLAQVHVGPDRAAYSRECCDLLCKDIDENRAGLLCELYQKPGVLEGMIAEMEYPDLLEFARVHGNARVEISEPEQIRALSRGVWNVIKKLGSDELKQHVDDFNARQKNYGAETRVTGNPTYDRSREYCTAMNVLLAANETPIEMGVVLHQCHADGHLTMNMLDELIEEKANVMGRNFAEQTDADAAVASFDKKTLGKMYVAQHLPELNPDANSPLDVIWLGKINQFDSMLKGDLSGKDRSFRQFIHCWDEIRFKAMPAYNARHNKDGLVDTNLAMSKELSKISPAFLEALDRAKGDMGQVKGLLKKAGLRKAPDELKFETALEMADQSENPVRKKQLKQLAVQDFLYRYFEQRAGVEIPVIPPKPKSLPARKPRH